MASPAPAAPTQESLVTLKVNLDRTTHKFKLPLRFLGARCLEEKLRSQLSIASDANIKIERFSDSAAAYITLDSANAAVFKQLYRAAKAKQKLKLRITTDKPSNAAADADVAVTSPVGPAAEKSGPRPASVEDEQEAEPGPEPEAPAAPLVDVSTPVTTSQEANQPSMFLPTQPAPQLAAVESLALKKMDFSKTLLANLKQINDRLNERSGERDIHRHSHVPAAQLSLPYRPSYAVRCNNCNRNISEFHYHCSTCDGGDFDLCMDCVGAGATCSGTSHWMIKRVVKNGVIINSTTERLAPKPKAKAEEPKLGPKPEPEPLVVQKSSVPSAEAINNFLFNSNIRTCNSCVQDMTDEEFLHCESCEDFDLCKACFAKNQHGHHPKHAFAMAVPGTRISPEVMRMLGAGRDQMHHAACDGCDKNITGVRHKCLDCPDWDYCSSCVVNAAFIHTGHRFVPIYEPIEFRARSIGQPVHHGICCDGPLCGRNGHAEYIVGDRYKCAVCSDTDFCANCEANPANEHNRTHPLIKFKTPVRHVSVTTTGAHGDGQQMPAMGDRMACPAMRSARCSPSRLSAAASQTNTDLIQAVQSAMEEAKAPVQSDRITRLLLEKIQEEKQRVKEIMEMRAKDETEVVVKQEIKEEAKEVKEIKEVKEEPAPKSLKDDDLVAVYKSDTIADGTEFGPNQLFEQTWILRNEGQIPWPAGCSVKFVGGDYMGHVDSSHPAATSDIVSASESTVAHMPLYPGQEAQFSVLLRTPNRSGRAVSNWRLTTKDGLRFGHRLWCDVVVKTTVQEIKEVAEAKEPQEATQVKVEEVEEKMLATASRADMSESQMIFPKLEKESPVSSVHGLRSPATSNVSKQTEQEDEYEDCAEDDEWVGSDEGFVTDEEYDILDASDEEVLEGKRKGALKK